MLFPLDIKRTIQLRLYSDWDGTASDRSGETLRPFVSSRSAIKRLAETETGDRA